MKITIYQTFRSYKKDSIKYLIFEILNKPFVIFLSIYIIIFLVHFLNKISRINFFPEITKLLTFSLGIGISGMILYSVFCLFRTMRKINSEVNTLYEGKVHITMNDDCIMIQKENDEYSYKMDWNQIKELVVINETAYLIPVKKGDFMIRINKKEVVEGNFQDIVDFIVSKWKG